MVARKYGKLLKNDVSDLKSSAKIILTDFYRGNIMWYNECEDIKNNKEEIKEEIKEENILNDYKMNDE